MKREAARHWGMSVLLHGSAVAAVLIMQTGLDRTIARKAVEWDVSVYEPPRIERPPELPQQNTLPAPVPAPVIPRPALIESRQANTPAEQAVTPSVVSAAPDQVFVPEAQNQASVVPERPLPPSAPAMPFADGAWVTQTLWGLMNARKRYPLMARRMGTEGKVLIQAVIDDHGQAAQVEIKQSSGSPILDQDALALLRSILPLTSDKFRFAPRTIVVIPVAYALDR